ncbi:ribosomal protein S18 acetylase RimI-like enzyme [Luteococcus japonicus]|uniref:Ribosomal protein S18 acetylase RimI-like enzyme n=2 Tax=Luteococcus japonicus TaxID=33984 RepID=A0A3N1ZY54_9ACTN|nr:ribosomal protein S18 acetylase RimI-like enzyme [Luteococcus japonicus]
MVQKLSFHGVVEVFSGAPRMAAMSSPETPQTPTPPVAPSVRLAMPAEALQISEIQRRAWARDDLQRRMLDEVDLDQMAEVWHRAITRPPLAHFRVLVAVQAFGAAEPGTEPGSTRQRTSVCGFAAVGPSDDPDADPTDSMVAEFCVDPLLAGQGHEDRLMHAAVNTMQADGYLRATWWLLSTDDQMRSWLTEAGWAPDGAHREVGTPDGVLRVKQIRMHTDISPSTGSGNE